VHSTISNIVAASFPCFKGRNEQRPVPFRPLSVVSQNPSKPTQSKKRSRKPEFAVFVDADASNETPKRTKTSESGLRTPLSVRSDSANSTPVPSPRLPTTPFPVSVFDPLWFDGENYDPSPTTPPSSPVGPALGPTPTVGPPPPPTPRARITRGRRIVGPSILPTPRNTILYDLLEIQDRNARSLQITTAYRKVAMRYHPDKVPEAQREAATEKMQRVNLAKEVLLDSLRRRQYHVSGELPWAV
jgi:hypothetical protein